MGEVIKFEPRVPEPSAMRRIGRFDMLVYRLFYWRWNPILRARPDLAKLFERYAQDWLRARREGESGS